MKTHWSHRKSKFGLNTVFLCIMAVSAMGCTTKRVVVHDPAVHAVVVDTQGAGQVVVVKKQPPPPRREVRPRRPSSRHVWIGGYWSYRGSNYVWVSGYWKKSPRHGAVWVSGYWKKQRGSWAWVGGRWR